MSQLILWSWSLAALAFGLVAAGQARHAGEGMPRRALLAALAASALWALAMAGIDARDLVTRLGEAARTLAWLGFMWALARRGGGARAALAVGSVYGVVALVVLASAGLAVAQAMLPQADAQAVLTSGRLILRMMVAVSALVLTHHLHAATAPGARGGLRLLVAALAIMWACDLFCYAGAYLAGGGTPGIAAARGVATLLLVPVLAVAAHRDGAWTLQVSRTVTVQSLSALALALYLGVMLAALRLLEWVGGEQARLWETAFVVGSTTAVLTLAANPWLRAWIRVKLAKHLFAHRYDYRAEWTRFTDTLGQPGIGAASLEQRVVKAVADLTCSPAGLLLVPAGGALEVGAGWNWDDARSGGEALARHLATTGRIIELDPVRAGNADPNDAGAVPDWMLAHEDAWAVVPLVHLHALTGAILLARPPVDRAMDWEDFDLLRICGRQVASYLAEARALDELAEARRFDEFNRRFAFIAHDIKNLVSQLSLVARNAERHADKPAFRADMVATLRDSADKMNALLARLSQHHGGRPELAPVEVRSLAERIARERRAQHPVIVEGGEAWALADEGRLEQLLVHLVQNAIEASIGGTPVTLRVEAAGASAAVDVIDRGCGMSAAFLRDELFRPFHSSKPGGFGIGAFEARQLAQTMGGTVTVTSRVGEGTRFRVALPAAVGMEQAA